ncbi:PREDICTED: zinc finger protein 512B-like [Priapulus caudatus]|uniref:Zinc finger protein 512B-like n=1 Tax=Priapulus caudatus TaxID=37621 RepID=A0ABM1EVY1_PRICU|nr:PREDICTED: zinc finger protein 512B-like [Priapulus caudatus]
MPRRKRGKSKKINMESRADEPDQNEDETVVDQPADEDEDAISKEAILPIEEDAVSIATEVPVVMIELVLEDAPVDSTTEQSAIEEATPETDDVVAEPNEDPELVEPDDQERSIKDVTVDFIKEDLLGRQQTRKKTYFRQVKTKEELPSGYQRPQRPRPLVKPRKVKAIQLHAWQALIRNDGYVRCPLKYCGREMRSVAGMSAHYLTCKGLPPSNDKFQCGFCGKFQNDEPALVGHMEDAHPEWDTYVVDDNEPVADGDAGGATAQEEPESPPPPVKRPRGRPPEASEGVRRRGGG